jgi:hypothetical protein
MKMREYVDSIQGQGSWDGMHKLIGDKKLLGWSLPPIEVDGHKVSIFPGEDPEVTLEDVQNEIRKAFAAIERGEYTELDYGDL